MSRNVLNLFALVISTIIIVGCSTSTKAEQFNELVSSQNYGKIEGSIWYPTADLWKDCLDAGDCKNSDGRSLQSSHKEILHSLSQQDAEELLKWIHSWADIQWRLPMREDEVPTAFFKKGEVHVVRGTPCFEDERFLDPSSSPELKRFGLPEDFKGRISVTGVICNDPVCLSCAAFGIKNEEIVKGDIPSFTQPLNVGIVLVREEVSHDN